MNEKEEELFASLVLPNPMHDLSPTAKEGEQGFTFTLNRLLNLLDWTFGCFASINFSEL